MKKSILWGALFTVLCSQGQAENALQPTQPINNTAPVEQTDTNASSQPAPTLPAVINQPIEITTEQVIPPPVINCDYKISSTIKTIEKPLVLTWSEKAAAQAFSFSPSDVDNQLQLLQSCFTDQGWVGFNNALQKSGNIEAIKNQHLSVTSRIDGTPQLTEIKENQWKASIPLQVLYQNDKEKVTQLLNIDLTIGRKTSGDLGIMQMIATPRPAAQSQNIPTESTNQITANEFEDSDASNALPEESTSSLSSGIQSSASTNIN